MLYVFLFIFSLPLIFTLEAASISHFLTVVIKFSCYCSNKTRSGSGQRDFLACRWPGRHEQNNVILKGFGGILGLGENSEALRCWMVAGPEVAGCLGNLFRAPQKKGARKAPRPRLFQTESLPEWRHWGILLKSSLILGFLRRLS